MKVNASEWRRRLAYSDSLIECERTEAVSFTYYLVSWTDNKGNFMRKMFAHNELAEAREYAHRMTGWGKAVRLDKMEVAEVQLITTTKISTEVNTDA
jgi:Tfp pilus assembly protein PilV